MIRPLGAALLVTSAFAGGLLFGRAGAPDHELEPEWTVVAELSRPRAYARAIALPTGEILIVGGMDADDANVTIPTSELFDPESGKVTVLPGTLHGRLSQALTIGWGDRVVMTGGGEWLEGQWRTVSRVDVYLPYSRTWMRGANMRQPRGDHGAAALPDGRIFVTGGNQNAIILKSSEIYDPSTDMWTPAAPLPAARTQFTAASLPDGRVLVAGGFEGDGRMTQRTWLYEPWADAWVRGPDMLEVRLNHSVVALPGGDLLFFGGERTGAGTAERYSWRERQFVYAGVLGEPRLVAQGALLPDGRVLAVGGLAESRDRKRFIPTVHAEVWDPAKRLWIDLVDAPTPRAWAQLVSTGRGVYRISGVSTEEVPMRTIEALVFH